MPSKKKETTVPTFDTSALDALDPTVLADRQRIVDLAVRKARNSGYCEVVESFLRDIMPEFGVMSTDRYGDPFVRFYSTDGTDCRGDSLNPDAVFYNEQGYDRNGYDRDGWYRTQNRKGEYRQGRPATEEEAAAEAAVLANMVSPTTYQPTA